MLSRYYKLKEFVMQSRSYNLYRKLKDQYEDLKENRELIGTDRLGNKYYQYYSHLGLPIRREIRFKNESDITLRDLVYYQWLHQQVYDPPTEVEKETFYLEEKIRYENALEWDRQEAMDLLEMKRKREELLLRDEALKEIEEEMGKTHNKLDIKTKRHKQGETEHK